MTSTGNAEYDQLMAHVQSAVERAKLASNIKELRRILPIVYDPTFYHSSVRWFKSTSPDGKERLSIRDGYPKIAEMFGNMMKLDVAQLDCVFEAFEKDIDKKKPSKIFH